MPGGGEFEKGPFSKGFMPPGGRLHRAKGRAPGLCYFRNRSSAWLVTPSRSARSQVAKW